VNRALRTLLVSAAVLLSGTVAFAVAAAITPPGVDNVNVVVTDRPVLSIPVASALLPPAAVVPSSTPTRRADKPPTNGAPAARSKPVVTGAVSNSGPKTIVVPVVRPQPPRTNTVIGSDHEVVTPPVRDENDEHGTDSENKSNVSAPSADFSEKPSRDTTLDSGYRGD